MHHATNVLRCCLGTTGLLILALLQAGAAHAQTLTLGARSGATVRPLLGVNVGPGPQGDSGNVDLTAAYQLRGVNLVRNHDYYGPLDMATLYPDRSKDPLLQSSYNFSGVLDARYARSSDSVFSAIVGGGFEPYFRLGDSYNNVRVPDAAQRANWVNAAVQVLKHYRLAQWDGFNSSFRFVEIGNEPNNRQFWPLPLTTTDFNQLYDETAKALRSAFPTLRIGGPGWGAGGCTSAEPQAFVRAWLDYVKTSGSPLDFLSFHVYSSNPDAYLACAQFYRTELDKRGMTTVDLHISEWNTQDGAAGSAASQLRYNAQGAASLSAGWIKLQGAGVAQSTFYRGTDPAANVPEFFGMFNGDGRSKKIAEAFSLWRDFTAYPLVVQTTGTLGGSTLMAAENVGGARAVLAANPGATGLTSSISFSDGKTLADYQASVATVSDTMTGESLSTLAGSQFSIPAKSTVLLRLTPREQVFAATGQATVAGRATTLGLSATLSAGDVGKPGAIYVIALVGGNWFSYNGFAWQRWTSGDVVPAFTGNLPPAYAVTPIAGVDLTGLSGTSIYLAYGTSFSEMLTSARFKEVYRVP